jgi:hypothetical protein
MVCQTILLLTSLTNVFGQRKWDFIEKKDFPKGLDISMDTSAHTWLSNSKCLGHVTFSNTTKSVTYHVFHHNAEDSISLKNILSQRLKMQNCKWKGGKNRSRSIPSYFIRKGYYFISEFCPCGSTSKGPCGDIGLSINKWLKQV